MKTKNFSYNIISKYRSFLMGMSILSIIIFHYTVDCVNNAYNLKPHIVLYNNYIGSCGVDIFLFLSGFGLYYSFKKDSNQKNFYIKRFSKILIPYFWVAIPTWFIKDILILKLNFISFIKDLFFITFWENGTLWFWYILMISICYLIFPYCFDYINGSHSKSKIINIFLFFTVLGIVFHLYNPELFSNINIALLRFPAFFIGSIIGKFSYENRKIPKEACVLLFLAILLLSTKSSSTLVLSRYILGLFGISFSILLAILLELADQNNLKMTPIKKFVEWCGSYSLELYLTHVALRGFINYYSFPTYRLRFELVLVILSFSLSFILKKVSNVQSKRIWQALKKFGYS